MLNVIVDMIKPISVILADAVPFIAALTFSAAGFMLGAANVIGENTLVQLSVFIGGIGMLVAASWSLSARIQKTLSKIEHISEEMDRINRRQNELEHKIERRHRSNESGPSRRH